MSTGYIQVTPENLHSLSSQVAAGSANIQDELTRLQTQVMDIVNGGWQGGASTQFQGLWEEWQNSAKGLQNALSGISSLLGNAGTSYQNAEDHNIGLFNH